MRHPHHLPPSLTHLPRPTNIRHLRPPPAALALPCEPPTAAERQLKRDVNWFLCAIFVVYAVAIGLITAVLLDDVGVSAMQLLWALAARWS